MCCRSAGPLRLTVAVFAAVGWQHVRATVSVFLESCLWTRTAAASARCLRSLLLLFVRSFRPAGANRSLGARKLDPRRFAVSECTRIRTYGCAYCSSHTAVMGSVWKGSGLTLEKNALAMAADPDPKVFSKKELAAIKIAKKV